MTKNQCSRQVTGSLAIGLGTLIATIAISPSARAATYEVYTSSIAASTLNANDGYCSLAEAVASINQGSPAYNCHDIDPGGSGAITLIEASGKSYASYHYVLNSSTPLTFTRDVRIQTSEEGFTAYVDSAASFAFKVNSGVTATFYGMNIRHTGAGSGRVIWNEGALSLANCTIRNGNVTTETQGKGGGIYNHGSLTLYSSQVLSNSAKRGGGIYNDDGNIPYMDATISGNTATMAGGGIYNMAIAVDQSNFPVNARIVTSATITSNSAKAGGGIFNRGAIDVEGNTSITSNTVSGTGSGETCHAGSCDGYGGGVLNFNSGTIIATFITNAPTTVSSNTASGFGGAFYSTGQLNMPGVTINSNTAKSGGAIYVAAFLLNGSVTSNYCDVNTSATIKSNKTSPTGGYSIVDTSGQDPSSTFCTFNGVSASGNTSPRCKAAGLRPGTSCPQ